MNRLRSGKNPGERIGTLPQQPTFPEDTWDAMLRVMLTGAVLDLDPGWTAR
ncbi:hypothetical protein [Deinococcus arenicola]|uniref:Uncharacterized protein n=1 Tax=Deinococcus arenicola TaxID=2994950 RepID=A0ABU4DSU1_9DEIO|nr:hypothetical protein [Deinococcus sp. ZS9-10]MDV6375448.1 hypothetical protein [Deinococcus sp. ZS9-10]